MVRTIELTSKVILNVEDIGLFASSVQVSPNLNSDHLFDVSATHCDVFFPEITQWEPEATRDTPLLFGVPGNVQERSNTVRCL